MNDCSFTQRDLNTHRSVVLSLVVKMAGAIQDRCRLKARFVYTIQKHESVDGVTYSKLLTWGACAFSCNLPPALLAE